MKAPPTPYGFDRTEFSRQLETLRVVAFLIGENACTQDDMDTARDLVGLLKYLNEFDRGLN